MSGETKKMIVEITLISFFLGTSMENAVFQNAKSLMESARRLVVKKDNRFYFKTKYAQHSGKSKSAKPSSSPLHFIFLNLELITLILTRLFEEVCNFFTQLYLLEISIFYFSGSNHRLWPLARGILFIFGLQQLRPQRKAHRRHHQKPLQFLL